MEVSALALEYLVSTEFTMAQNLPFKYNKHLVCRIDLRKLPLLIEQIYLGRSILV